MLTASQLSYVSSCTRIKKINEILDLKSVRHHRAGSFRNMHLNNHMNKKKCQCSVVFQVAPT